MSTRFIPTLILSLAVTTGVVAQLSNTDSKVDEATITLELNGADLVLVLDLIAKQSGSNLVIAESVSGRVSASMNNVPWRDALHAIAKTAGCTWVEEQIGSTAFIRVTPGEDENPITPATAEDQASHLEMVSGWFVEPSPFFPEPFPAGSGKPRPLDLPVKLNRTTSQTTTEHTLALALLDYWQETAVTTPLPTSS